MTELFYFHHRFTSNVRQNVEKKYPGNHIEGFLRNVFVNQAWKQIFSQCQKPNILSSSSPCLHTPETLTHSSMQSSSRTVSDLQYCFGLVTGQH